MPFGFRSDADLVRDASPTRRIMPFLMRRRNESSVSFDVLVDATGIERFVAERRASGLPVTVLHLVLTAAVRVLTERPRLNRFVQGYRLWQRRGIWLSFSAKLKKNDEGELVALKRQYQPGASLDEVVTSLNSDVKGRRSGARSMSDRELSLVLALPVWLTSLVISAMAQLDRLGMLPRSMIDADPLFASVFIANLGSIDMDPPQHHLYEWGNIPLFVAMGRIRDDVVQTANGTRVRRVLPLRITFDERVEDGLYCKAAIDRLVELLKDPNVTLAVPAPTSAAVATDVAPSTR